MPEPFRNNDSGNYYISFSYQGTRYKRSAGTSNLAAARRAQKIVDGRVEQLKAGLIEVPDGVSLPEFVFDGKTEPDRSTTLTSALSLIDIYLQQAAPPNKAESTYTTEKIHLNHFRTFLKTTEARTLKDLTPELFENYKRYYT